MQKATLRRPHVFASYLAGSRALYQVFWRVSERASGIAAPQGVTLRGGAGPCPAAG